MCISRIETIVQVLWKLIMAERTGWTILLGLWSHLVDVCWHVSKGALALEVFMDVAFVKGDFIADI